MKEKYNNDDKKFLLEYARQCIFNYLNNNTLPAFFDLGAKFFQKKGVFVTLHKNGELRGCIGYIEPIMPLIEAVRENAVAAAVKDWRFSPVTFEELSQLDIEISILSKPEVTKVEDIKAGQDGVVVQNRGSKATFLPQVWEELPEKEEFLAALLAKAGLSAEALKDAQTKFFKYQVESFGEKEGN